MPPSDRIGIFDSGFGGLTVMRAIRNLLPHENLIYFGDTGRLPYGTKSGSTILRYSIENATFLMSLGIKALVIACHTACCFSLSELQSRFPIPILGVIAPAIETASKTPSLKRIAILGTRSTISSGTYQSHLQNLLPETHISAIPCPLLVHLVEEGYIDHPITSLTLKEYLRPLKDHAVDALILGCTHFPLLLRQIQEELGPTTSLIDPAESCAASLRTLLTDNHLLNPSTDRPHDLFYVSDDPEKFRLLGRLFLGHPIEDVRLFRGD